MPLPHEPTIEYECDHALEEALALSIASEIERYLRTGQSDPCASAWPGGVIEGDRRAHADLSDALVSEVLARSSGASLPEVPSGPDLTRLTRAKVRPMVRGLFPAREQDTILALLEKAVVFLTPESIVDVLRGEQYLHSAWDIANIYLGSIGAQLLGDEAPDIVGLSEETRCFVSARYFEEKDRFADYLVHEAAHIFHNWKRERVGLPFTRYREWLLPIDYMKRETFAYACEAYARICEIGRRPGGRAGLVEEFARGSMPTDERVNREELLGILREASPRRNGWKVILGRCAPPPRKSMAEVRREQHEAWVRSRLRDLQG